MLSLVITNFTSYVVIRRSRIENTNTAWTSSFSQGQEIVIPLKNGEGAYMCDDETLAMLEGEGRIIARYVGENPNGSRNLIAGITNERGNIVGLMPHPEHAIDSLTGPSADGLRILHICPESDGEVMSLDTVAHSASKSR